MIPLAKFKTVLRPKQHYLLLPRSFYREWRSRNHLDDEVQLHDDHRHSFICIVEDAPRGEGHLKTDVDVIAHFHHIIEAVVVELTYEKRNNFRLSIPIFPSGAPSQTNQARNMEEQTTLWESDISPALATSRQPLVSFKHYC